MEPTTAAKVVSRARRLDVATAARVLWTVVKLLVALFLFVGALQLMKAGEKTRFWVPAKLAYPNDPSKPQGTMVFDIELLEIR